MSDSLQALKNTITSHLMKIERYFNRPMELTFIARDPMDPEADVLITSEADLDKVIALLERSKARKPI